MARMKTAFREALIAQNEIEKISPSALHKATGVSLSKINKLLARKNDTIELTDAIAIAAHYGKSVEAFVFGTTESPKAALAGLCTLLSDKEAELLLRQIKGVVASRDRTPSSPEESDA